MEGQSFKPGSVVRRRLVRHRTAATQHPVVDRGTNPRKRARHGTSTGNDRTRRGIRQPLRAPRRQDPSTTRHGPGRRGRRPTRPPRHRRRTGQRLLGTDARPRAGIDRPTRRGGRYRTPTEARAGRHLRARLGARPRPGRRGRGLGPGRGCRGSVASRGAARRGGLGDRGVARQPVRRAPRGLGAHPFDGAGDRAPGVGQRCPAGAAADLGLPPVALGQRGHNHARHARRPPIGEHHRPGLPSHGVQR